MGHGHQYLLRRSGHDIDVNQAGCQSEQVTLASKLVSRARGTSSAVLGKRSLRRPMKMLVSSAVSLPMLKSLRARSSTCFQLSYLPFVILHCHLTEASMW